MKTSVANSCGFLWMARITLALAFLGAVLLFARSLSGEGLPGCPQGNAGCGEVLASKWAQVLGLPVSIFGAILYLLLQFKLSKPDSFLRRSMMLAVVAGAIWFVLVQVFIIKTFCPWCCAVHGLAVLGVGACWLAHRDGETSWSWQAPSIAAAAGVCVLAALQVASPERRELLSAEVGKFQLKADSVSGERVLIFHEGTIEVGIDHLPRIGNAEAEHLLVALVDYSCGHCRKLHAAFKEVEQSMGGQVALVELPAARSSASREIHRQMLALYRSDPKAHQEISERIYAGEIAATPEAVKRETGELREALEEHGTWIDAQLRISKELLAANKSKVGTGNLPQFLLGDEVFVGSASPQKIYSLLGDTIGIERNKAPRLEFVNSRVELGEVFAGTGREVSFEFKNVGNQAAKMEGLRMPPQWRVLQSPPQVVASGESASFKLMAAMPPEDGMWEKEIGVLSTAAPAEAKLTVEANVRKLLSVEPPLFEFKASNSETPSPQTVRITLEEPASLGTPTSRSPLVDLELKTITEFKIYELVATPKQALKAHARVGVIIPLSPVTQVASDLWPKAMQVPLVVRRVDSQSPSLPTSDIERPQEVTTTAPTLGRSPNPEA